MSRPLRIADPDKMAEAWGSELYPMSFNDGFAFYYQGYRVEKPYWWAWREAKALGHRWPKEYAHGFCQGYRFREKEEREAS